MSSAPLASIILAAGQGTRMRSDRAKVLHELAGEPLVSYPIRLSQEVGARPIVLVVGHQRDAVRARVEAIFPGQTVFAEQIEQRGTGHAAMEGLKQLAAHGGRILILYGDVPLLRPATIRRLLDLGGAGPARGGAGGAARAMPLAIITTIVEDPKGYGRVVRDPAGKIVRIVEEKDASEAERRIKEINAGIYLVEAELLASALRRLTPANAQGEYYLTDVVGLAIGDGHDVGSVIVEDSGEVLGANTRAELAALDRLVRRRIVEHWMAEGVTFIDPATTYVSGRAKIGRDTVIHPGVHLRGATEIGPRVTIDVGCVLADARVAPDVELKPYTVVESAVVGPGAIVGPFARLRPGAELLDGAHVGNFVELKNTRLGRGAKANHLAYLGDATIGDAANVGAGTITCNYDGFGKYRTEIGANVFVGSNATLVAPLKIEESAYVAAGSTITDPVGANDLAFGRSKQVNKPGRAADVRREAAARAAEAKKAGSKSGS